MVELQKLIILAENVNRSENENKSTANAVKTGTKQRI